MFFFYFRKKYGSEFFDTIFDDDHHIENKFQ